MSVGSLVSITIAGFCLFSIGMWMEWWRVAAIGLTINWLALSIVLLDRIWYLWSGK